MSPPSARSPSGSAPSPRIVLASASPRRREILERLGLTFTAVVPAVEELTEGVPEEVVVENALRKARAGLRLTEADAETLVLGVDTDVALDGRLLGKPEDVGGARRRLQRLSGRTHEVLSGVAAVDASGRERSAVARTQVRFHALDELTLARYLASEEWRDRAGGYAIQGLGSILVESIAGDFSNVVGLPVPTLLDLVPELSL